MFTLKVTEKTATEALHDFEGDIQGAMEYLRAAGLENEEDTPTFAEGDENSLPVKDQSLEEATQDTEMQMVDEGQPQSSSKENKPSTKSSRLAEARARRKERKEEKKIKKSLKNSKVKSGLRYSSSATA